MTADEERRFVPGMTVAGGRYRLIAAHGGRARAQFWQALDTACGQHVALTLVDPARELPEEFVHEILSRTVRLRGLGAAGVAQILDVLHTGFCGLVVSEWVSGGSLWEIAQTGPSPATAASAMQSLAAAAEAAHRAGLVLSIDHPSRLRVSEDGHAVLAFPAVMPEATAQSDLRGMGGALYALLVNRWPSSDGACDRWACAESDSHGRPVEPAAVNPEIPFLLSTTVAALLRDQGGIASAATLLTLLRQVEPAQETNCRVMSPLAPPPPGGYATFRNFGPDEEREAARGWIIRAGLAAAAVIVLVAVLSLASTLNAFLGANDDEVAMDADKLGLIPHADQPRRAPTEAPQSGVPPGDFVTPTSAAVFSPDGSPDSPESAGLAIDGKPDTAWSTDRYYDADPFPAFKSGVGLLLELAEPTSIGAVTVDLGQHWDRRSGPVDGKRGAEDPGRHH